MMLVPLSGREPARVRVAAVAEFTVDGLTVKVAVHKPPKGSASKFMRLCEFHTGMRLDGMCVPARALTEYRPEMLADAWSVLVAKHGPARVADVVRRGLEINPHINA